MGGSDEKAGGGRSYEAEAQSSKKNKSEQFHKLLPEVLLAALDSGKYPFLVSISPG